MRGARVLAVVLGSWFPVLWAQGADPAITLPEAGLPVLQRLLGAAVRQSPAILERELEVAFERARLDERNAPRLPRVAGQFDLASNETAISGLNNTRNRDSGIFYRLELNQAIFHWGALKNETVRGRIAVAIAERNHQEAYRQLAVSIRQSYLMLIAKRASLEHARGVQQLRQTDLRLAREKLQLQTVPESELAGRILAEEEGAVDLRRQEVEFEGMRRTLARVAGLPELREDDIPVEIPPAPYQSDLADGLLAGLMRDHAASAFEVQIHDLRARDADLAYRIARVRLLPKIGVSAGYYLDNTTNASAFTVTQQAVQRQTIGLRADWSIFDGFATRGAKQSSLAAKRLSERRRDSAAEQVLEQAQQLRRVLAVEAESVRMAERRRDLAAKGLERAQEEVRLGNVPPGAAEQVRLQLLQASAASAAARAQFQAKWSELVSLAGADPLLKNIPVQHARDLR